MSSTGVSSLRLLLSVLASLDDRMYGSMGGWHHKSLRSRTSAPSSPHPHSSARPLVQNAITFSFHSRGLVAESHSFVQYVKSLLPDKLSRAEGTIREANALITQNAKGTL